MAIISHSYNSADVLLWRALNDIDAGAYVDVGPEPAEASVTHAFYERGWQGVVLRPDADQVARFAARRPRDAVHCSGDLAGLAASMPARVHFARIDAGDADTGRVLRVLMQADPWIVLIRAGNPAGHEALAAAHYRCAQDNGTHHFYLAAHQAVRAERLREAATVPADTVLFGDAAVATRLAEAEAALGAAQVQIEGRSRQLLEAVRTAGQARADLRIMAEGAAWLRNLADEARDSEARLRAEAAWLRERLATERSDLLGQLLLRADQVGWLQECLASSEAQLSAERALTAQAEHRARRAETAIANSRVLRAARALRGVRRQATDPQPRTPPPASAVAAAMPEAATLEPECAASGATPAPAVAPTPALSSPLPTPPPAPALASPQPPVTTVHQFHAGSAVGDAITNAMLLIRALLRARGFHSEIFVESRGAGLEDDIHLLAAMPRHAGIVLLVHHSMGFPSFDEVLALPARKVLIYHNITPPALLGTVPQNRRMAVVGRQQLSLWRDQVGFALADSEYNAVELRALGFATVRSCTLLFDIEAIVTDAAKARRTDGVLTVLFVGRVTPAKAQHDLIEAFAVFRRRLGRPSRLVLAGALDPDEHRYLDELAARIAALGLEAEVQLTGLISDQELRGWYRQADLYVSLSHHEGFGVPLVEALAYGVPVLAWPTGAVPYTLGDAGRLLASRDPAAVADEMLAVAARGETEVIAGPALARRWGFDRHVPILLEALAAAGAMPPASAASHALLAANVRVTVAGDVDGSLAVAIETHRPGSVRVVETEPAEASDRSIQALAARPDHESGPVLVLTGPLSASLPPGDLLVAVLPHSQTPVPPPPAHALNPRFDAVFVASNLAARALVDAGVFIPVLNLGATPADFADRVAAAAATVLLASRRPAMRVAWFTTWQVRCGIAEYSRTLLDALPRDRVTDLTILADDRSEPGDGVARAWRLGDDTGNPARLGTAIAQADADVVVIQHQPGLLPWPVLAEWLDTLATASSRPPVILLTLHNTRHLLTLADGVRGTVVAALRRVARILVHTLADLALLDSLGLSSRATLLRHPAPASVATYQAAPAGRALPADAAPIIGSTGFFLPDKGLPILIAAVASLRDQWPGIRLRLVNAEYDDPASAAEIAACKLLAASEGLAVEWRTDFIPLDRQAELLAGCDLIVLPYQRSLEASSAALRNALASLVPVAVTPLPLFEEAEGATFRLPGLDPAAIASGIAGLLRDSSLRRRLPLAAADWLRPREAAPVARQLHGLMLGLATARTIDSPLDGSLWQPPSFTEHGCRIKLCHD